MQVPLPSVTKALLSAEAFPPSLRDWFAERGITGYQCYGTADLGLIAYETEAREGLVLDENVIVEIVRPGTGDPVPEGEVGEDVLAELQKMNPEKVSRFAQKHGWQLNKHDSDPEMPELPKNGLGKSWAAWQLLETMRLNDKASSCTTCAPETRINKGRAEFFGEKR